MKKQNCVIYKISNTINDKFYIGSTSNFPSRKAQHKISLKRGTHNNRILQNHVNKYGYDSLIFSIIEIVECPEKKIQREQFYIDTLNPHFNIHKTAQSPLGIKRTPEQVRRIMENKKTKSGWKLSKEACEDISRRRMGHSVSIETRNKISKSNKGKKRSAEVVEAIRNRMIGYKHSDAAKEKMSIKMIGNKNGTGKKRTQEQLEKMSKRNTIFSVTQFDMDGNKIKEWATIMEAATALKIREGGIRLVTNGIRKSYMGFIWVKNVIQK